MPYRAQHVDREKKTAEPGIVADMVRQFADKHAFLRELVQNGIDAGATRIDVRLDRDDSGIVRTSVTDDGAGMSRATIEGPLLTLFSSSKEGDKTKIGKYGIGFVSVFALEPDHVEVRTSKAGEGWLVRLFGDHSWELEEDRAAEQGTTVTLVQPMTVEVFSAHVEASLRALVRWCRHARIPVDLLILDAGDPNATRTVAIQEPFAAEGSVTASWEENGERIVVGVGGPGTITGGYYSRGLTLHESTSPERDLGGIRFKIDSPSLSHTLSRDDVVRNAELKRLMRQTVEIVRRDLSAALHARIASAAASAIRPDEYLPFLEAASVQAFTFARKDENAVVPLADPVGGKETMTIAELRAASGDSVLVGAAATPLTRAVARTGRPVVRWIETAPLLRGFVNGVEVHDVNLAIAYAAPAVERHPEDDALEAAMLTVLRAIDRNAARVHLATFEGALRGNAFRVTSGGDESVLPFHVAEKKSWGKSARVFLNVDDAAVRLARRRAKTEPVVAAHLLCRALLVADGPLPAKLVDRLLEAALE